MAKKHLFILAFFIAVFFSSCSSMSGKMLQKGFYEMEFDTSDYAYAMSVLKGARGKARDDVRKADIRFDLGFSSAIESDCLLARTYNDYVSDDATFVIRIKKGSGRFASIGVSPGMDFMNDEFVSSASRYDSYYKVLPFLLVDGMNENGVAITLSSYPVSDFSPETVLDLYRYGNFSPRRRMEMIRELIREKQSASFEEKIEEERALNGVQAGESGSGEEIFIIMSVRYLLDNARSAEHATELLKTVRLLDYPTPDGKDRGYHFMIADENSCYCVEFVDGQTYVDSDVTVMTDFSFNNLNAYSVMGQERYDILRERQRGITSRRAMVNLMKDMYYSKAYDVSDPLSFWYTECYSDKGLFAFNPPSLEQIDETFDGTRFMTDYYSKVQANQASVRRIISNKENLDKSENILYSSHISVYDIKERNLTVIARENGIEYDFGI